MYTFEIHPNIRVVGELLPQGHDLLWRRRARLYMEVPAEWPVPKGFRDRLKDGRIPLDGDFRIRRGKLIRQDWHEAWQQVSWYYMEVQEIYWKDLFSKGIILAFDSYKINEFALSCPWDSLGVRVLVPKSIPHRAPDEKEKFNSLLIVLVKNHTTKYYPSQPLSLEDYDDFPVGTTTDYDLSQMIYVDDFESARKTISGILGGEKA